jgi:hypothetical protein
MLLLDAYLRMKEYLPDSTVHENLQCFRSTENDHASRLLPFVPAPTVAGCI